MRRSSVAVRRPRRKLIWCTTDQTVTLPGVAPFVSVVDLLAELEVAGTSKLGVTVVRQHHRLESAFNGAQTFTYGIGCMRLTDVGGTQLQPLTNHDVDWMLLDRWQPSFSGAAADGQSYRAIDLRSKRRVDEMGQTLVLAMQGSILSLTFQLWSRVLVALP
jgi:hypothetical protein